MANLEENFGQLIRYQLKCQIVQLQTTKLAEHQPGRFVIIFSSF